MQGFKGVVVAGTMIAVAVALGGCFHGHHTKTITHEPLKLGSVEQTVRA